MKVRTLREWDGSLHRIHPGMYAMNYGSDTDVLDDIDDVEVSKFEDAAGEVYWQWDVTVAGGRPVSDHIEYPTKKEATQAAYNYVRFGDESSQVRPIDE